MILQNILQVVRYLQDKVYKIVDLTGKGIDKEDMVEKVVGDSEERLILVFLGTS